MEEIIINIKEFLSSSSGSLLLVGIFFLVMFFVWGKLSGKFLKKFLFGAVWGIFISASLYFVFRLPLGTVAMIGLVTFVLGIIFKKVERP